MRISADDWRTVIGVAGDTKHYTLNETQLSQGYIPHAQRPQIFTSLVVRRQGNPLDLVKSVRDAIWRVDRDQPVWRFRSMEQDLDAVVTSRKTMMWLTALFAIVALVVAAVGVYGVLSYTMAQRTQEVGIRIALGAEGRQVVRHGGWRGHAHRGHCRRDRTRGLDGGRAAACAASSSGWERRTF